MNLKVLPTNIKNCRFFKSACSRSTKMERTILKHVNEKTADINCFYYDETNHPPQTMPSTDFETKEGIISKFRSNLVWREELCIRFNLQWAMRISPRRPVVFKETTPGYSWVDVLDRPLSLVWKTKS